MSQPISTVRADNGPLTATAIPAAVSAGLTWFACEGFWGNPLDQHRVEGNIGVTFVDGYNDDPMGGPVGFFYVTVPAGLWMLTGWMGGQFQAEQSDEQTYIIINPEIDGGEILNRVTPQDPWPANDGRWWRPFSGWLNLSVEQRVVCASSTDMNALGNEAGYLQIAGIRFGAPIS